MRQVHGDHVPDYDQGDLRVPDEGRPGKVSVNLIVCGTKEIPTPPKWIRDQSDDRLALDEQVCVVVGHLIGNGDGYKRVDVCRRESSDRYVVSKRCVAPANELPTFRRFQVCAHEELAYLHEAQVNGEVKERQHK